jgi:hypothetical protein
MGPRPPEEAVPSWPTALLAGAAVLVGLAVAVPDGRAAGDLLRAAPGGDGDSWRDASGPERRLGLVNAPEHDECFGPEATAERRRLTAKGYRAQPTPPTRTAGPCPS